MLKIFSKTFLLVMAIALFGCQPTSLENAPIDIKLEKYAGELKIIKIEKDGDVYSFLYDTGGGYTALDAAYAETFGCNPYGKTVGFRLSGEQVESQNCNPIVLDFGGLEVTTTPKVMDINSFLPEGLPKLAGLISLQTFQDYPITINYSKGVVRIENLESFQKQIAEMTEIPLKVTSELDGEAVTVFAEVLKTPEPLWFYLDSGNLRNVLVAPHAEHLLNIDDEGALTLQIAGKDYLTSGEIMEMLYDGVLDVRFFKNYLISLDLQNSRAWVKRTPAE